MIQHSHLHDTSGYESDAQAWGHHTCAQVGGIYESPEVHLTQNIFLLPVK